MAEPLRATFFALQHRDRAVLVPATIVTIVLVALLIAALAALNWRFLSQFVAMMASLPSGKISDAEAVGIMAGMFGLVGTVFLFLFPLYLVVAAYEAACLRWMIRGEAPGLFGLTLDHDTWRVYGVYWCWFIAQLAVSTATSIVAMPFMFATLGEVMRHPADLEAMWRWQLSVQLPIALVQYLPLIFIGVRFGPAAATSVARRRFSFFEAWTVTRGRFWELLGSFALLWLIAGVVIAAAASPVALRMWPHFAAMWADQSGQAMQAYFNAYLSRDTLVLVALGYGVMCIAGLWLSIMGFGVNARAARVALEEGKISPAPGPT